MDIRMYNRVREASDPQAYESYVRQKVRQRRSRCDPSGVSNAHVCVCVCVCAWLKKIEKEIEKRRASHITAQKHLPSVNKMYAKVGHAKGGESFFVLMGSPN